MKIFRYENSQEEVNNEKGPKIFLAGPTVRGNQPHLTSWRFEAIEYFEKSNFQGSLIVPEFTSKTESDKGKKWVPLWEYNGLCHSNKILFWIPRTRELIGLTTNWELGFWMGFDLKRVVYGRPDDAFRIDYLDTMWEKMCNLPIYNTLESTIDATLKSLYGR